MAQALLKKEAAIHKCDGIGCAFKSACGRYLRPEAKNQLWGSFYALPGDDCAEFESCVVGEKYYV